MIIPIGKRILVQPIEETKQGNLIVANRKPSRFTVMAIGDEITKVKVRDTIFLEKHYGAEIDYEKEKYLIIEEENILAKEGN